MYPRIFDRIVVPASPGQNWRHAEPASARGHAPAAGPRRADGPGLNSWQHDRYFEQRVYSDALILWAWEKGGSPFRLRFPRPRLSSRRLGFFVRCAVFEKAGIIWRRPVQRRRTRRLRVLSAFRRSPPPVVSSRLCRAIQGRSNIAVKKPRASIGSSTKRGLNR